MREAETPDGTDNGDAWHPLTVTDHETGAT